MLAGQAGKIQIGKQTTKFKQQGTQNTVMFANLLLESTKRINIICRGCHVPNTITGRVPLQCSIMLQGLLTHCSVNNNMQHRLQLLLSQVICVCTLAVQHCLATCNLQQCTCAVQCANQWLLQNAAYLAPNHSRSGALL
jgi:hypothetical protein